MLHLLGVLDDIFLLVTCDPQYDVDDIGQRHVDSPPYSLIKKTNSLVFNADTSTTDVQTRSGRFSYVVEYA